MHPARERRDEPALRADARRDACHHRDVRRVAAVLLALAICAGAATAYVRGRPDPQTQAQADGCPRDLTALYQRQAPPWGYIGGAGGDAPAPPPPRPPATR